MVPSALRGSGHDSRRLVVLPQLQGFDGRQECTLSLFVQQSASQTRQLLLQLHTALVLGVQLLAQLLLPPLVLRADRRDLVDLRGVVFPVELHDEVHERVLRVISSRCAYGVDLLRSGRSEQASRRLCIATEQTLRGLRTAEQASRRLITTEHTLRGLHRLNRLAEQASRRLVASAEQTHVLLSAAAEQAMSGLAEHASRRLSGLVWLSWLAEQTSRGLSAAAEQTLRGLVWLVWLVWLSGLAEQTSGGLSTA